MSPSKPKPHVGILVYYPKDAVDGQRRRAFLVMHYPPEKQVETRQPCGRFYSWSIQTLPTEHTRCSCGARDCVAVSWKPEE